jgi:ATP-dependent Clp protease ATP-binding subunit ClpA
MWTRVSPGFTVAKVNWLKSFRKVLTEPASAFKMSYQGSSDESMSNFTPRAQQVLALARKEADRFNHNFLGTEHLLLGLIKLGQGVAVNVIQKMGLDLETVRMEVEKQVGTGPDQKMIGNIPYTPRVKKVLALASKEAKALNHTYVGTEHILLGLLREGDGVAAKVLKNLDVDIEQCRQEILKELDPNFVSATRDVKPPESPPNMDSPKPGLYLIDISKHYDVYCNELNGVHVVYRNALVKGRCRLLSSREHELGAEFIVLEQSNGQTVYLSLPSVYKFCEHGVEIISEIVPPK